ncbi:hypothetical protein EON81_02860 [bacterium]|nr:MAG: hypothetical protein EON81_02860 [bacterium]
MTALREWRDLVTQVESGYEFGVDDYLNDLSNRQILQRALDMEGQEWPAGRKEKLEDLDARFLRATEPWPEAEGWSKNAWWIRKPIKWLATEEERVF